MKDSIQSFVEWSIFAPEEVKDAFDWSSLSRNPIEIEIDYGHDGDLSLPSATHGARLAEINLSTNDYAGKPRANTVGEAHFGMNFVYDYEQFGDKPWQKFDEIVQKVSPGTIRYPGGIGAETTLDIRDPNRASYVTDGADVTNVSSLSSFMEFCKTENVRASVIIPTLCTLTDSTRGGHRDFDVAMERHVYDYVMTALSSGGVSSVRRFEIGNEYETHMSAVEYGRVASAIAEIAQKAIDNFKSARGLTNWDEPEIAVQVWTEAANEGTPKSVLADKNLKVIAEFDAKEAAAVDALVTHFYFDEGSHKNTWNTHRYDNIDEIVDWAAKQLSLWETYGKFDSDLTSIVSEWNVNHKNASTWGLQQAPIVLKMFSSFIEAGIDEADFWSSQYKPTSIAQDGADLSPAGELIRFMSSNLRGMEVTDAPRLGPGLEAFSFESGKKYALLVASHSDKAQSKVIDLPDSLSGTFKAYILGVDESTADGFYKGTKVPAYWADPDAEASLTAVSKGDLVEGGKLKIELRPHEILLIVDDSKSKVELPVDEFIFGTPGNDVLDGDGGSDRMEGKSGHDRFVVNDDTDSLQILDFEVGVDKLDLREIIQASRSFNIDAGKFERYVFNCVDDTVEYGNLQVRARSKAGGYDIDIIEDGNVVVDITLAGCDEFIWDRDALL
ncbi:hypothetical protein [Pseudoroseicyclus sp. CXY001]|uniref:hypothetical protein n=1 Tax=Pseudoroseicyclus sp. CXY001 TaxID=3242492 RepID=UPI003571253B